MKINEKVGVDPMLGIRMEHRDLELLKAEARKLRIPPSVYARTILIQALQKGTEGKK